LSSEYIPGSCNIGTGEIKRRQAVALFGLFLTIFSITTLLATDQNKSARLSVFIPVMIFSIGFIQSRSKFCLAYGLAGTFNFDRLGKISKVGSAADRMADRKTAGLILIKSIALAALITAVFFVIPL
jgi:hypothetical protein